MQSSSPTRLGRHFHRVCQIHSQQDRFAALVYLMLHPQPLWRSPMVLGDLVSHPTVLVHVRRMGKR